MSSNWWDGPERGPNRDWRNQKGWGKTRPGPYEGKHGKTEDISEDEEIQRPKKGKGKKPQEKKGGELPELSWSDGKKPEWDKPPKKDGQTPDPNRAMVLLEEIEGPKKGKILLISWESKRWTLPSKALDSRDNLLGFAEMPNLPEWKILAREAIREWTGITEDTNLELKHHGVYGAMRYMVMSGRIGAALASSFENRTKECAHKAAFFELGDEAIFPTYRNVKDIMLKVKDELEDGVWEGAQPKTIEEPKLCKSCSEILKNLIQQGTTSR